MKKYFDRASSMERWFLILSGLLVFIVANLIFVRPLFGDWAKYQTRRDKAQITLKRFEDTIAQSKNLEHVVKDLEGQGMAVPPVDQTVNFMLKIQEQALSSGVAILSNSRQPERTNLFFVERAQAVNTLSGEEELVDFLYHLGSSNSLIRVRGLSLRPDNPRQKLSGNITLVASYQKKAPAPVAATTQAKPAATNASVTKPLTNAIPKVATNKLTQPPADKSKPPGSPGVPKPVTTPTKNPK